MFIFYDNLSHLSIRHSSSVRKLSIDTPPYDAPLFYRLIAPVICHLYEQLVWNSLLCSKPAVLFTFHSQQKPWLSFCEQATCVEDVYFCRFISVDLFIRYAPVTSQPYAASWLFALHLHFFSFCLVCFLVVSFAFLSASSFHFQPWPLNFSENHGQGGSMFGRVSLELLDILTSSRCPRWATLSALLVTDWRRLRFLQSRFP